MEFRMSLKHSLGFRVQGLRFRVQGFPCRSLFGGRTRSDSSQKIPCTKGDIIIILQHVGEHNVPI